MNETSRKTGVGDGGGESSPGFRIHRPDLWVAIVVWAICGVLYARTYWFDSVPSSLAQNVQPTTFPRLVLITIALITLILPFEHFRKLRSGIDLDEERSEKLSPVVPITAAILVGLVAVMPILGALPALILVAIVLPILWGERRWKVLVPYILLFPLAVLFLFAEVLQVTFPRGLFGGVFN